MKNVLAACIASGLLFTSTAILAENSGVLHFNNTRVNNDPQITDLRIHLYTNEAGTTMCEGYGIPPDTKNTSVSYGPGHDCAPPQNPVLKYIIKWRVAGYSEQFHKDIILQDNTNCTITATLVDGQQPQDLIHLQHSCNFFKQ
ncbi:MAG: hypothetical protein QM752_06485 [Gammaproteobacteria bacterium]